jgi:hypothetical protein
MLVVDIRTKKLKVCPKYIRIYAPEVLIYLLSVDRSRSRDLQSLSWKESCLVRLRKRIRLGASVCDFLYAGSLCL